MAAALRGVLPLLAEARLALVQCLDVEQLATVLRRSAPHSGLSRSRRVSGAVTHELWPTCRVSRRG